MDGLGDRANLLASITKMSAIQKENEKKLVTSQTGLFDLGHHNTEHLRFSLEKAKPLSFEERIRGEKQSIGYSVSGHGLDGLRHYINKRSIGMEHITEWRKKMSERGTVEMEHEEGTENREQETENREQKIGDRDSSEKQ